MEDIKSWLNVERELKSCLSAYGVGHVTISPELEWHASEHQATDCGTGPNSGSA